MQDTGSLCASMDKVKVVLNHPQTVGIDDHPIQRTAVMYSISAGNALNAIRK